MKKRESTARPQPADQGFGTQIATARGQRLLNRDGSFTVRRTGLGSRVFVDLYDRLLRMSKPSFLLVLLAFFLAINIAFACCYLACGPNAIEGPASSMTYGRLERAFFLSVHTIAGVGYGFLRPVGFAANMVSVAQSFMSLLLYALATGLVFARFARPIADIAVSNSAIVGPYRDGTGLMIRIANRRPSEIINLHARLIASYVVTKEGRPRRQFQELTLERDAVTFFPMAWTIVHPIDAASPLHGWTARQAQERDLEILVTLTGIDETEARTAHMRTSFVAEEIEWDVRFADIFERGPAGNPLSIDVSRIGATET